MFVASRPGVAGGEKARRAATIMEFAHVSGAGQDDVAEIVWIGAETIAGAQFYQVFGMICISPMAPFCDRARNLPPLFDAHHCAYPMFRRGETLGYLRDKSRAGIDG